MREKRAKVRYLRARVEEAITERSIGSVQSKALSPSLSLSLSLPCPRVHWLQLLINRTAID